MKIFPVKELEVSMAAPASACSFAMQLLHGPDSGLAQVSWCDALVVT